MQFQVKTVNGEAKVVDDAGKPLEWVHTVDLVFTPGSTPMLYIGTTAFSVDVTAGDNPAAPKAA